MDGIFFLIAFIIYGLVKIFEWLARNENYQSGKGYTTRQQPDDDDRYLERIFILDAAANGVFVPGAERVFDNPDKYIDPEYGTYDDDCEDDSYYDDYAAAEKDFYDSYS
ncbi:MAG TPA: hypothetical protein PK174_01260 [Anaerolineaceae bacterium]|nr:hypothetical protein [Anaerolineaceae bacterium]